MEGLYDKLLKYLLEQRGELYPELSSDNGEYIINNAYLNYLIVFIKSMRYNVDSGVEINYERLSDELKLFKYYSNGKQNIKKLHMFAVIGISYANEKEEDIDREIEKYCKYCNIGTDTIPELLYFAYMIKACQRTKNIGEIKLEAKNLFIKFSFKNSFKSNEMKDIIKFEKKRVELLGKIIIDDYSGYKLIETFNDKIVGDKIHITEESERVNIRIKELLGYLIDIRKGRIKTITYNIAEIKLYNEKENSVIEHSNFGECTIVKNIKNEEGRTIIVNTHWGCYRLKN